MPLPVFGDEDQTGPMSNILLRELSDSDIDWLMPSGQQQQLVAAVVLSCSGQLADSLYLLLEGCLAVQLLGRDQGSAQRLGGKIVEESWLFDIAQLSWVMAVTDALVLAIPRIDLFHKLQQNFEFSVGFYRAIALPLSEQILGLFEQANLIRHQSGQIVKETLFLGELRDSDINWMLKQLGVGAR